MGRVLKYLLIFILAAAFRSGADIDAVSCSKYETACVENVSSAQSHFDLPLQTSIANIPNVQGTARRTSSVCKNNIEFARSGKIVNVGLRYFIQLRAIHIHSSFIEPSHRLLCLGKLII